MKLASMAAALATLIAVVGSPALALQDKAGDGDILKRAINKPSANWQVIGANQANSPVKDKAVVGGGAVRVQVAGRDAQPWAVAAQQPIRDKVSKGDVILVAFWAKAEGVDGGPATATIPAVRVQQSGAPYDAALQGGAVRIGGEWAIYTVPGKAGIDIPAGGGNVSLHLAVARQTVLLGPVFVLDFGPDYDLSKL
jgi:hypothetical protein